MQIKNLYQLLEHGIKYYSHLTAVVSKENGIWTKKSWSETKKIVDQIGNGLLALGLKKSNTVCILSQTRLEWSMIDLAILSTGGVTVPIYHSNTDDQCAFIINDSESRFIFVEDIYQLQKVLGVIDKMPNLTKIISITNLPNEMVQMDNQSLQILSLVHVIETGIGYPDDDFQKRCSDTEITDIASIVYTSGTTGQPKGAMITHENFLTSIHGSTLSLPNIIGYTTINFLPLAHIFARSNQFVHFFNGVTQWYAQNLTTLSEDLKDSKPNFFCGVPRVFEKVYNKIIAKVNINGGLSKKIFFWALEIGHQVSILLRSRQLIPKSLQLKYNIAKVLVFNKILDQLGGRLKFVVSGGAPLSIEILEFFHAVGIIIIEGYGLTETTSATHCNRYKDLNFGTVGPPIEGVECKLADDGEVLIRGKNIMIGYYKNEELTKEALDMNRWYYTGDIGVIDERDCLKIVDRKKDLIVTSGGKKIAPQKLENLLKSSQYINEGMVYGDKKKFISALITGDQDQILKWAKDKNIPFKDYEELSYKQEVIQLFQQEIDIINNELASFESIKKFYLLPRDFSLEKDELTPSLKLKRPIIIKHFEKILDQFYEERYN